jgi:hypothetical protein
MRCHGGHELRLNAMELAERNAPGLNAMRPA